jgi:hypothetical protein
MSNDDTVSQIREATRRLWQVNGGPPRMREVADYTDRSVSTVFYAWSDLRRQGVLEFMDTGKKRRLVSMAGIDTPHERIVRALAERGLLACDEGEALKVAREVL